MPTSYLQTEEICTVNKARVLKCRAVAHLTGFFIPSYACTLQNIWSRQGKLILTTAQASFILIFMRPIQRNQIQVSVKFCQGRSLGITPGKERAKATKGKSSRQQPGHDTPHCTHPPQQAPAATGKPWGNSKGGGGHRTCRKLSSVPTTLVFYLWIWAKRPFLPNQEQLPCCLAASQLWIS